MRIQKRLDMLMDMTARLAPGLQPDDDWQPILFFWPAQGSVGMLAIDARFLTTPAKRQDFADNQLPKLIARYKAIAIGFVSTVYAVDRSTGEQMLKPVRPSEQPDRREELSIEVYDTANMLVANAVINRRNDLAPLLSPFKQTTDFVSRFKDPVQAALRLNS